MFQNEITKQYKENTVHTMSPEDLTLMLYNGLIKFLMKAEGALSDKNNQSANDNLLRAQDIVNEFIATLDLKYEVSQPMLMMYDYMVRRLIEANVKKDTRIVGEIMGYAKELRDTWQAAMKIARADLTYRNAKNSK